MSKRVILNPVHAEPAPRDSALPPPKPRSSRSAGVLLAWFFVVLAVTLVCVLILPGAAFPDRGGWFDGAFRNVFRVLVALAGTSVSTVLFIAYAVCSRRPPAPPASTP